MDNVAMEILHWSGWALIGHVLVSAVAIYATLATVVLVKGKDFR